jgi:putative ABC transport system substrate-binding protein
VGEGASISAAKQATRTIPIVMFSSVDAVEQDFVASLAHPGANVTGLTTMTADLETKRLELLKETVPGSSHMTVLGCKGSPSFPIRRLEEGMQGTALALGVHLQLLQVQEPEDYPRAFAAALSEHVEAMVVVQCYVNAFNLQRIVDLAAQYRLPAIYSRREWVQAGGLMAYGPNVPDLWRRAAYYVDRILKGTKPADLPVEQPTKFELVINLKTAKTLGLTIPPSLLVLADEVIQ